MRRKILSLKLNNNILVSNLNGWDYSLFNNKKPILIVEENSNVPNDYEDVTSIINFHKWGYIGLDYYSIKYEIREYMNINNLTWNDLNEEEKEIILDYYINIDNNLNSIIIYYINKGKNINEIRELLMEKWYNNHIQVTKCFRNRFDKVKLVLGKYLNIADCENLLNLDEVIKLIYKYTNFAILGKNYNDNSNGIMDFIESTNDYQNNGLRELNYQLINGTYDNLINDIKHCLYYGYILPH